MVCFAQEGVITRGGLNISPAEIERVLIVHPAVRDVAVAGVPDAALGQHVAGFVQLERGVRTTVLRGIQASVMVLLTGYKVPETIEMVDEIPRNALGKVERKLC